MEEVGGRRFVKGLTGKEADTWRGVSEGIRACREDIGAGEARLAEDVRKFEQSIAMANATVAAEKVRQENEGFIFRDLLAVAQRCCYIFLQ